MLIRPVAVCFLIITSTSGCTSLDFCNWWGRNTDGSSNLGRNKPQPYQQGPLSGTYNNPATMPANTIVTPPGNPSNPVKPPVVISSPVQPVPTVNDIMSPALTPPSPPVQQSGALSGQNLSPPPNLEATRPPVMQTGSFASPLQVPDNQPSIQSPAVPGPQVQPPALDLTLPGSKPAGTSPSTNPMPLVLMPGNNATPLQQEKTAVTVQPPVVDMLPVAPPVINDPLNFPVPRIGNLGKPAQMNPGTVPPPLAPPPSVPAIDSK